MKSSADYRRSFALWLILACCSAFASLSAQTPVPGATASRSDNSGNHIHMGIGVAKPSKSVYAQLPDLPKGSGFILQSVMTDGPAAKAGLKSMDIIWKFDEQLLINENQMLVLLSQKKPGDRIVVSYFRSGKREQQDVVLETRRNLPPHPGALAMAPPMPGNLAMPMRVISYEDRSASISDRSGIATLTYREGKPWLHVEDAKGDETFNGYISDASELAMVPAVWRTRLPVLERSLEESVRLRKLPRVRRVITPKRRIAVENP
ncbi:MAG: PDZ domain-containing protein [Akkermansiaceae bacterium]